MKRIILVLLTATSFSYSLDLSHLNDYLFIDKGKNCELQGFYSNMGNANFKGEFSGTDIHYQEGGASAFVGGMLTPNNGLCLQTGVSRMRLDWEQNPRFNQKDFDDLVVSLAWINTSVENWRWIFDLGAHIDTKFFNLVKHTFYTGFLWGRLSYKPYMGFHYGVLGQAGVKSRYFLPIIGMDTFLSQRIGLNLIFPLDFSLNYYFSRELKFAVKYRSFGGWYRANHRVGNDQPSPGALVNQHSMGVDGGFYYNKFGLSAAIFGGYDFGGWLFIQNADKSDQQYYHFEGAPYIGGKVEISF